MSFHAHPDDEALLTGGTLARAAAEGHRVVLVTATDGAAGLTGTSSGDLGARRVAELHRSAAALGCARVEVLGYADSGSAGRPPEGSFATLDPEEPARRLAAILREESADVLTGYDPHGGYGHRDHVQVHRVARRAAELADTPVLLEASLPREALQRVAGLLRWAPGARQLLPTDGFASAYVPREDLTHRIDVRRHLDAKTAALAAHHSQTSGGGSVRTVALLLALPRPLLAPVLGLEWFRQVGSTAPRRGQRGCDDVFASLR